MTSLSEDDSSCSFFCLFCMSPIGGVISRGHLPEGGAPPRLVRPVCTKDGLFRCLVLEWLVSSRELLWSEMCSSRKLPVPTRALVIMSFKSLAGLINIIFILNVN